MTFYLIFYEVPVRSVAVADPDLQIRGGGEGALSHPDPEIRGGGYHPKNFFGPLPWITVVGC